MKNTLLSVAALLGLIAAAAALLADTFGFGGGRGLGTHQELAVLAGLGVAALATAVSPRLRGRVTAATGRLAATPPIGIGVSTALGAWAGLLFGFVELIHVGIRKYAFGRVLRQPLDIIWMMPLSYLVLFGALGVLLGLLARALPRLFRLATAVFVLAAVGCWSQLRLYGFLDPGAVLLVSIAVGWQLARCGSAVLRPLRVGLPALLGLLIALAIAAPVSERVAESRAVAALPPAPDGAPNVLLIVLDTVRADHMSLYGYRAGEKVTTTPHIDRFAEGGVTFEDATSPSPWTLPTHSTLFTGRWPHQHHADWLTPLDDSDPTLAEVLGRQGYATAGFVANLGYCSREWGLARGFQHYEDFHVEPAVIVWSSNLGRSIASHWGRGHTEYVRNDAATVTQSFLDWLPTRGDRPFFAFLNYYDAHALYLPPEPYATRFGPKSTAIHDYFRRHDWSRKELQGFIDAYDGAISYADAEIGRLLEHLRSSGSFDDTLVVIVSDHGEQFGEHGLMDHANSLYQQVLHVPCSIVFPGRVPAGRRLAMPVSLRDLPATILGLLPLELGTPLPGHSLASAWDDSGAPLSPVFAEVNRGINRPEYEPIFHGPLRMLRRDHYKLIVNVEGTAQLFDLATDPAERRNLAARKPAVVQSMREQLDRISPPGRWER